MDKTLRIALCDDDAPFRRSLRELLDTCMQTQEGIEGVLSECGSGRELLSRMGRQSFDLIFLDIDMPGTDGILLGKQLRSHGCQTDIIYVSNLDERVYEIFDVHPWSFVRKSRYRQELPGILREYIRQRQKRNASLMLQDGEGRLQTFYPEDITYVEAMGKQQKLRLFSRNEPVFVRSSLMELEQQMLPLGFIRIHKGFLVNFRSIRKITSRSVLLDTGENLPIGRDRLKAARETYLSLMKWKGLTPGETE